MNYRNPSNVSSNACTPRAKASMLTLSDQEIHDRPRKTCFFIVYPGDVLYNVYLFLWNNYMFFPVKQNEYFSQISLIMLLFN